MAGDVDFRRFRGHGCKVHGGGFMGHVLVRARIDLIRPWSIFEIVSASVNQCFPVSLSM